jgi:hypothetical protein
MQGRDVAGHVLPGCCVDEVANQRSRIPAITLTLGKSLGFTVGNVSFAE